MNEHVYRISEILTPVEEGQRPEHSAAVVGITPPIGSSEEFEKSVVGASRNVSLRYHGTKYDRISGTGETVPRETFFIIEVGGSHYDEEAREKAINAVAKRICRLAGDQMLSLEMRADDPVPHRPVN